MSLARLSSIAAAKPHFFGNHVYGSQSCCCFTVNFPPHLAVSTAALIPNEEGFPDLSLGSFQASRILLTQPCQSPNLQPQNIQ
jgi:hypothetical protein